MIKMINTFSSTQWCSKLGERLKNEYAIHPAFEIISLHLSLVSISLYLSYLSCLWYEKNS